MKITEKINNSRYTFKQILSDEWDTSVISDYSIEEIDKIYTNIDESDQYLNSKAFGNWFICNIRLPHLILKNYNLHIIYYNCPKLSIDSTSNKVTKSISDKISKLYENEYFNNNDSVIIVINETVSESIQKNIDNLNIEFQNNLSDNGLNEDIIQDFENRKLVLGEDYNLNHFKNVTVVNVNTVTNNLFEHRLIPEHVVIRGKKEINRILDECNANINQLPIILKNDVIAKLKRMSAGDICKIKRRNDKCGENIFYRVCK